MENEVNIEVNSIWQQKQMKCSLSIRLFRLISTETNTKVSEGNTENNTKNQLGLLELASFIWLSISVLIVYFCLP